MLLFEIVLANPSRRLHISAETLEEAQAKFKMMEDIAGVTPETTVVSFQEKVPPTPPAP